MRAQAPAAVLVALAILAATLPAITGSHAIDDAYITMRYARSLAEGHGLVYNPGEAVLGTTSPLFALVLAGFMKLGAEPRPVALGLACAADAALVLVVVAIARRLGAGRLAASLAAATLAIDPATMRLAVSGMETSLFTALAAAALLLSVQRRTLASVLLAGLASLTRPEGYLVLALVLLVALGINRRRALVAGGLAILVVGPWLIGSTLFYGSPVPQSAQAKGAMVYDLSGLDDARVAAQPVVVALDEAVGGRIWKELAEKELGTTIRPAWIVLMLATLAAAVRLRRDPAALVLLAFPAVMALGYAIANLQGHLIFEWYLVPVIPFALAVAASQFDVAARGFAARWSSLAVAGAGAVLLANQVAGLNLNRRADLPLLAPAGISTEREDFYRRAALSFPVPLSRAVTVALPEIGSFGYFSQARVLDTVGLVSPEALAYYPIAAGLRAPHNPYAIPPRLILELRPDYVATLEIFVRNSLLQDAAFLNAYELLITLPTTAYDSRGFLIFRRRA